MECMDGTTPYRQWCLEEGLADRTLNNMSVWLIDWVTKSVHGGIRMEVVRTVGYDSTNNTDISGFTFVQHSPISQEEGSERKVVRKASISSSKDHSNCWPLQWSTPDCRVSTARLQSGSPNEGLYKHSVTGRTTLLLSTKSRNKITASTGHVGKAGHSQWLDGSSELLVAFSLR